MYGTLAAGPAFVGALLDFLSEDNRDAAKAMASSHPPPELRIPLALEVLKRNFPLEAEERAKEAPGLAAASPFAEFVADISHVVRALLDGPYPEFGAGTSLPQVLDFVPLRHEQALADSRLLLAGHRPDDDNPRSLFASAACVRTITARLRRPKESTPPSWKGSRAESASGVKKDEDHRKPSISSRRSIEPPDETCSRGLPNREREGRSASALPV